MGLQQSEISEAYEFVTPELDVNAHFATFSKRIQLTYARLIEAARNGQKISVGDLVANTDTNPRRYLSKLLDVIGYVEESKGNPPTTIMVIRSGKTLPANGFLELADTLVIRNRYESATDEELIAEITDEFFAHYGGNRPVEDRED